MLSRRNLFLKFAVCFVASGFVVASVLADELLGVLSKVDVEGKKITVVEKDTDKEIEVKITDDTEQTTGKNKTAKVDLEKLEAKVKKAQDANKKVNIKVTHDKNVASKLEFPRGKGGAKKKDN
jgi:biopolymer transport protein ExbD